MTKRDPGSFRSRRACVIAVGMILLVSRSIVCFGDRAADARVKPGSTFYVDFPELGRTSAGNPARMGVYIPKDYTPDRNFPLVAWFGGGKGSDSPGAAVSITGGEGFVCVGLPYRWQDENTPGGWSDTPWSYYAAMLDELADLVPNIDSASRICGGFSSGGCAVMKQIGSSDGAFQEYFFGFMPGGAGWAMGELASIRGRPMFAFIGQDDERLSNYQGLARATESAGVDIRFFVYEGGHNMPVAHYPEMREWMLRKVVMRELPDLMAAMRKDLGSKRFWQAYQSARKIMALAAADMPEYTEAENAIAFTKPHAGARAEKLLGGNATLTALQQFARHWEGSEVTEPVAAKCNAIAEQQLDKILSRNPLSAVHLKRFLALWEGFPVSRRAMDAYDELAGPELVTARSKTSPATRSQALRQFIAKWSPAPSTDEARQLLEELAQEELAVTMKTKSKSMRKTKLRNFTRTYAGTAAAEEARKLLHML